MAAFNLFTGRIKKFEGEGHAGQEGTSWRLLIQSKETEPLPRTVSQRTVLLAVPHFQ